MNIINYNQVFFEDLVDMYYEMTKEIYSHKHIGNKQMFYREIDRITNDNQYHIVLAVSNGKVVGFSKSYIDYHSGLYSPDYYTELLYVKPSNRGSKALYMLAKNIDLYAKENGLDNVINARIDNGFSETIKKHYNTISSFEKLEQRN